MLLAIVVYVQIEEGYCYAVSLFGIKELSVDYRIA